MKQLVVSESAIVEAIDLDRLRGMIDFPADEIDSLTCCFVAEDCSIRFAIKSNVRNDTLNVAAFLTSELMNGDLSALGKFVVTAVAKEINFSIGRDRTRFHPQERRHGKWRAEA